MRTIGREAKYQGRIVFDKKRSDLTTDIESANTGYRLQSSVTRTSAHVGTLCHLIIVALSCWQFRDTVVTLLMRIKKQPI